jgi:hypothetical protein
MVVNGSDQARVACEDIVGGGRALHAEPLAFGLDVLLPHRGPKGVLRLGCGPVQEAPARVQAIEAVPAECRVGLVVSGDGGFFKELVELGICHGVALFGAVRYVPPCGYSSGSSIRAHGIEEVITRF